MKDVFLVGRALASALGLNMAQARSRLCGAMHSTASPYALLDHADLPYQRVPDSSMGTWDARARSLIERVAADVGALQVRDGALFIAISCLDGDAAQNSLCDMDFHALAGRIAQWLQWTGPVFLISSACTSSMQALLSAVEWLRACLGSEAVVIGLELDNGLTLPGFAALQLLSPDTSKPFAMCRNGLVLGEAVAALRLSTRQSAPWILLGGANVVDGNQPTGATARAVALMCQRALAVSGLAASDVDLVKVQAAGSPGNDAAEALGLHAVFATMPALISLKPLIGHCMGASGVAELALLLECFELGIWPTFCDETDPALGVRLAAQAPTPLNCVLASILGFGGSHAAVVIRRRQA